MANSKNSKKIKIHSVLLFLCDAKYHPPLQNRQWWWKFRALRSGGKRSILSVCEHLRHK